MTSWFRSRAARVLIWLAVTLVAAAYCIARLSGPSPVQTDLLALLPKTELDPAAERAVRQLADAMGDRVIFVLSGTDDRAAKDAAREFGRSLTQSGALRDVIVELPPFDLSRIAALYMPYRSGLLSREDRAALAGNAFSPAGMLARRMNAPLSAGMSTSLADDPFGWLERFLAELPFANADVTVDDNMLIARHGETTSVIVTAALPASAYEQRTQQAVREAVEHAGAQLRADHTDIELLRLGAVFYADAARRGAEHEVHLIGTLSALGIAILMLCVFRSVRLVALGFLSTAIGVLCALAATFAVFGKLQLLTLVFGVSLIGETVDYSIQYFVVHLAMGRGWQANKGVRIVRAGLTVALSTSLFGYAILAAVPFPALAQIACFAMVGIGTAYASVLWLLPALLPHPARRAPLRLFVCSTRLLARWRSALSGKRALLAVAVIVAVSAPGWLRLTSDDDIHLLVKRDPSLAAEERMIRETTGFEGGSQFFLIQGADEESVLRRCETLVTRLEPFVDDGRLRSVQSISQFVPSAAVQRENRRLLDERLRIGESATFSALTQAGLRDEVAHAYLSTHRRAFTPLDVQTWLNAPFSAPWRHLWLGRTAQGHYAAIVLPAGPGVSATAQMRTLAAALPGTTFVDKAASVSSSFGTYRRYASLWLAAAFAVVVLSLALRYGIKSACAMTAPVALGVGVALAVSGYAQTPLNLFNWLATMLVLCVGSNYPVFLREGMSRRSDVDAQGGAVWIGVLLSAATALLSFGTLALTSMPALRSFAMTLAPGIACCALLAPMGLNFIGETRRESQGNMT